MEKIFQASTSNAMAHCYPEELRDDSVAALLLSSTIHLQLDNETAIVLQGLKEKFIGGIEVHDQRTRDSGHVEGSALVSGVVENLPVIEAAIAAGNLPALPQLGQPMFEWNPPELPPVERLHGLIGRCSKPFEKQLTESDVRDDQSRLSLNKAHVIDYIIPLLNPGEKLEVGIEVTIYDADGNKYPMVFKTWVSKFHVLTSGWKAFCHEKNLRAHQDFVTVWMFRHLQTEKLCFVITSRRLPVNVPIKKERTRQDSTAIHINEKRERKV